MSFLEYVGLNNKVLANGAFDGIASAVELRGDVFDYDCSGVTNFHGRESSKATNSSKPSTRAATSRSERRAAGIWARKSGRPF